MFIYDESGNYITKTTIRDFHRNEMSVFIPGSTDGIERGARLSIMIVHADGASEYNGIVRDIMADRREISLFKGRHRQRRKNSRFAINTPAIIKSVTINANKITLAVPQSVQVVNISKSGTLINSSIKCFNVGTTLEIIITTNEKELFLHAQVRRELQNDDGTFDYGCRLVHQHESLH